MLSLYRCSSFAFNLGKDMLIHEHILRLPLKLYVDNVKLTHSVTTILKDNYDCKKMRNQGSDNDIKVQNISDKLLIHKMFKRQCDRICSNLFYSKNFPNVINGNNSLQDIRFFSSYNYVNKDLLFRIKETDKASGSIVPGTNKKLTKRKKSPKKLKRLLQNLHLEDGDVMKNKTVEKHLIELMELWKMNEAVDFLKEAVDNGIVPDFNVTLGLLQQLANLGEVNIPLLVIYNENFFS